VGTCRVEEEEWEAAVAGNEAEFRHSLYSSSNGEGERRVRVLSWQHQSQGHWLDQSAVEKSDLRGLW
jgi:hypothetical protein